jgi:alpha-glucosidase
MWWEQAVIYQVYVRSFQDANGDGIGDLPGLTQRLGHIAELGAQAVWLSPIYPSPNADFGYDVSDFRSVDPAFGTLEDLDALVSRAGELGLKVLLDFVPCHTSIEHPWFRENPDYYVWADAPNNWRAAFGGSSWGRDERSGRYFLHSFFPEQADLNWRNPEVREQMTEAMRFWVDRGVDGFRLDALDRLMKDPGLRDDPPATHPPELPGDPQDLELDHVHSRNAPDIDDALQAIRRAVGDVLLVGEVYLPIAEAAAYLATLDVVFNFEEIFAVGDAAKLRHAVDAGMRTGGQGWVFSNHDFSRLVTRAGPENARSVALLLLSLPGPVFMFQGDELGYGDAPMAGPEQDRNHRDPFRTPMVWDSDAEHGGFSTAQPWLTPSHPPAAGAAQQDQDPTSVLTFTRRAMALRSRLAANETRLLPSEPGTIALRRGDHIVAVNLTDVPAPAPAPAAVTLVLEARPGDGADLSVIPAHGAWIAQPAA